MVSNYIPDKGDIIWLDFNPQVGREQMGRRPALVLSHKIYNKKTDLALVCPITSQVKNYAFEVKLSKTKLVPGVVLSDQVKSIDWNQRNAEFIEKVKKEILNEVLENLKLIFE
jgi:mRNA interferase MazF